MTNHRIAPPAAPKALGKHDELDGIRALVICSVMIFHGAESILPGGWLGVDFFTLSSFLITSILLDEISQRQKVLFSNFYLRRILRLLPALFFLLIFFILHEIILDSHSPKRFPSSCMFTMLPMSVKWDTVVGW